jgi:hypothetical protein
VVHVSTVLGKVGADLGCLDLFGSGVPFFVRLVIFICKRAHPGHNFDNQRFRDRFDNALYPGCKNTRVATWQR